jgi:hypothetical protein
VTFDEFEMFISKINSKLSVLSVESLSDDITYLDLDRWEELILKYLPQLEKFYLKYHVNFQDDDETPMFYKEPYQFVSPFWTERQWIFDAEVDFYSVIYSIRPYKYMKKSFFLFHNIYLFLENVGMIMDNIR